MSALVMAKSEQPSYYGPNPRKVQSDLGSQLLGASRRRDGQFAQGGGRFAEGAGLAPADRLLGSNQERDVAVAAGEEHGEGRGEPVMGLDRGDHADHRQEAEPDLDERNRGHGAVAPLARSLFRRAD